MRLSPFSKIGRGGVLATAVLSMLAAAPHVAHATGTAGTVTRAAADVEPLLSYADGLALNGTADVLATGDRAKQRMIRLTNGGYKQIGSAWSTKQVDLTASFSTTFKAHLHHGKGADGIALLVQGAGPRALGGWGGGLGYRGIKNSVAVEFDTYQNTPDPNSNHLAVVLGGNPDRHRVIADSAIPLFGKPFQTRVQYDAKTRNLKVHVRALASGSTETLMLDQTVDLAAGAGTDRAWIGFTAATGEVTAVQDVYEWTVGAPRA